MDRTCTNCPGATDHDTANCPLMTTGRARRENIVGMREKINAQAGHIRHLEQRINFLKKPAHEQLAELYGRLCVADHASAISKIGYLNSQDIAADNLKAKHLAQPSPAPELKCPKVIGYACLDDIQWGGDITLRPEKSEHYSVPFAPVVWTGQVPEGWKLVPEDATTEMVEALKARMTVTNRGTVLNAGHALNAAIAAAPAQGGE